MSTYTYVKRQPPKRKAIVRILGATISVSGLFILLYVFSPLMLWQIYFSQSASYYINAPVPKKTIVNADTVKSLFSQATLVVQGVDYTNAENWFPAFKTQKTTLKVPTYALSIPKLGIHNAIVSTMDYDLSQHLVHYGSTAIPPDNGNAVIFGHSTLPQLFNPKDYKTIFANAYKLALGDIIEASVSGVSYVYKINEIRVVEPEDTSAFSQNYNTSYLTLITCTPPGTTWKRLVIKARLDKI